MDGGESSTEAEEADVLVDSEFDLEEHRPQIPDMPKRSQFSPEAEVTADAPPAPGPAPPPDRSASILCCN